MPGLLPLFPLQTVALPGVAVPLHIFEERYKILIAACERDDSEFGIVLAKDGGVVNAGCTVIVEKVLQRYSDGRSDIVTRGRRRFLIEALDQSEPVLRGEVKFFEDGDFTPVSPQLRDEALNWFREIRRVLEATGQTAHAEEPPADHPLLSFQLAAAVEDTDFQNLILRLRSEAERLRKFAGFAEGYVTQTEYVAKMKRVAPTNGSGHKPAGL